MSPSRCLALVAPLALLACSKGWHEGPDKPLAGTVTVCTDVAPDDGQAHDVAGTVVAIDDGATDCSHSVTIEDDAGVRHVVGWTVSGEDGDDRTPELDLAEGDPVELRVRSVLVFGDVQGLALWDADGLVVATDEGTWGGALQPDDVGFSVAHGTPLETDERECETLHYARILFSGDIDQETAPLETWAFEADGEELLAMGVASVQRGPGESCEVSDQTDELSWIVWR